MRFPLIATSFALSTALAGCSSFSSPSSSASANSPSPYQTTGVLPPNAAPAAGQPGSTAAPGSATAAAAPTGQAHVDFLNMFRDPPSQGTATPAPAAATGIYPSQSLVDLFKSDGAEATPAQTTPAQTTPARTTYIPHPPSTYTPSGQPYTPPPGQPAYGAPPASSSAAAAPAAAPPPQDDDVTAHTGAYPSQSLSDLWSK